MAKNFKPCLNPIIVNDVKNSEFMKFNCKEIHSVTVLKNLKDLLDENMFCDLILIAVDGLRLVCK